MYSISFNYKDKNIKIETSSRRETLKKSFDWLFKNGSKFSNLKIYNKTELDQLIENSAYVIANFHNLDNSGNYILFNSGNKQILNILKRLLFEIGVDNKSIKTEGFQISDNSRIKQFISYTDNENEQEEDDDYEVDTDTPKMTFMEAAQYVLKNNSNKPMTGFEVWEQSENLVKTSGKTPWDSMNAQMILYSENSTAKSKKKNSLFRIIEGTKPYKFVLINPDLEVQNIPDEYDEMEDFEVKPFGKFPQPFDVESELKKAQAQAQAQSDDIKFFKNFRAVQAEEEIENFYDYVKNPFTQAICVLGESGAGKSTTIDNILKKSGHVYQYIIPSASTTGLLSQFSPSAGSAGGYIPSRLGQMIEMAYKNKDKNYTAVFDECHKTSIIEMINDELLQAISKNRNKGVRFISLDDDTRRLYTSAQEDNRGNVLIPDNFGFIFISSNARVISGNPDFFNRVDLVELRVEDRELKTVEELNQKRVTSKEDKKELVNKIVSGGE